MSTTANKDKDKKDAIAEAEISAQITEEEFYETDPDLCDPDLIVNTIERSQTIPKGDGAGYIRLLRGDRAKGEYFVKMVKKSKVPGLQLCCKLEKSYLELLEKIRKERDGEEPSELIKEIWSLKKKE